jgi:hypothetical protein
LLFFSEQNIYYASTAVHQQGFVAQYGAEASGVHLKSIKGENGQADNSGNLILSGASPKKT